MSVAEVKYLGPHAVEHYLPRVLASGAFLLVAEVPAGATPDVINPVEPPHGGSGCGDRSRHLRGSGLGTMEGRIACFEARWDR
jgi:hypothetical protein